jgi:ferric-dicitrate binding protein FerR (iron transport regulator)
MHKNEVNKLIDKYLEGATTPEEELRLAKEVNRKDAPAEWKAISTMLGQLALDEAEYDEEMSSRRSRNLRTHRIGWAIAASIVVVAGIGLWLNSRQDKQDYECIAYVDGKTITDEGRVLAMAEDAVCDIFSNSDAESSLYKMFNPEE